MHSFYHIFFSFFHSFIQSLYFMWLLWLNLFFSHYHINPYNFSDKININEQNPRSCFILLLLFQKYPFRPCSIQNPLSSKWKTQKTQSFLRQLSPLHITLYWRSQTCQNQHNSQISIRHRRTNHSHESQATCLEINEKQNRIKKTKKPIKNLTVPNLSRKTQSLVNAKTQSNPFVINRKNKKTTFNSTNWSKKPNKCGKVWKDKSSKHVKPSTWKTWVWHIWKNNNRSNSLTKLPSSNKSNSNKNSKRYKKSSSSKQNTTKFSKNFIKAESSSLNKITSQRLINYWSNEKKREKICKSSSKNISSTLKNSKMHKNNTKN